MVKFLTALISGIDIGALDGLVALGILILYKATGLFNFAQGAFLTLAAYFAIWSANSAHLPLAAAYLFAIVAMFGIGAVLERVAVAPLRGKDPMMAVIATFGASYVISTAYEHWQGPHPQYLASLFKSGAHVSIGRVVISVQQILIVAVCAVVMVVTLWVFHRTALGRQVRALAADREVARLYGIRVGRLSLLAWGVSAGLAGLAAVLIGPLGAVDPTIGAPIMLNAFAAATLGGFGSIGGAILGALIIGIAQQVGGAYLLSSAYGAVWPYVIMILAVAIRPQGILARGAGERL
jgi:branched-chain amino acid transport system permease protein